MMTLENAEYRQLARDSSNLMVRSDGERVQGNEVEAALALAEAGAKRMRMAALSQETGDRARALADSLSATACFARIGDLQNASRSLEYATRLGQVEGRPDLVSALDARQREVRALATRRANRERDLQRWREGLSRPTPETLASLQALVPEAPGWARLHALIAYAAYGLHDFPGAARHASWAMQFDWDNAHLACAALVARSRTEPLPDVLALGERYLAGHPRADDVRIVLAYLIASKERNAVRYERALRLLEPLSRDQALPVNQRVMAAALAAWLAGRTGDARLLSETRRQARALGTQAGVPPGVKDLLAHLDATGSTAPGAGPETPDDPGPLFALIESMAFAAAA